MNQVVLFEDYKPLKPPFLHAMKALDLLKSQGWSVEYDAGDGPCAEFNKSHRAESGYSAPVAVNGKIVYVDFRDQVSMHRGKAKLIWSAIKSGLPGPEIMLKCQFRPAYPQYEQYPVRIVPFTYVAYSTHAEDSDFLSYRKMFLECVKHGKFTDVIYCRIQRYKQRYGIVGEAQGIPGADVEFVHWKHGRVEQKEYLTRLAQSQFSIDAPGGGRCTHRMVESWALGLPLIMPEQKNQAYVPWLAGQHYIECREDGKDLKSLIEYYKEHYDEALEIARNGMKYYDDHCSRKGIPRLFNRIMKEEGLADG